MRVSIVRIFLNGFEQFFFGGFLPAFLTSGDAEVVVRRRALRIQAERFGQFRERAIKLCLPVVNNAERSVREFVVGRERDRFFQGQLGGFEFASPKINDAEVGERVKIVRRFGQDFLINFFGRTIFAFIEVLLGLPGKIDNVLRNERETGFDRAGVVVGNLNDRLAKQR